MILTKFICMQKDLSEPKYEYLIKKHKDVGIKYCNDLNVFLSAQILWMTFMKILMTTTQAAKEKS